MDCSIKKMSSYQVLKKEQEETYADLKKAKAKIAKLTKALWLIAMLQGPNLVTAPKIALKALNNETEETQD